MADNVFVGLSGGVDSSVAAALLKEQGFDVVGVYMKNWSRSVGGVECPWRDDYTDAKRVAVKLGIPFQMVDFEKDYFERVVRYMLDAFREGITPNPDVMCNQEIKFKLFLDVAINNGANMIATGHYARAGNGRLYKAIDDNKDQTYFLYRVTSDALARSLFPVGEYTKPQIRALARRFDLPTAEKKESMGICFIGKVGIKDFLKEFISEEQLPGPIIDQHGKEVGTHDGALFYTIGQRSGLRVGGGLPYYVTSKDMALNTVYVTNDLNDPALWSEEIRLASIHWIRQPVDGERLFVRTRHRAPLITLHRLEQVEDKGLRLRLTEPVRSLTPGQSAVIYTAEECIGGGVIQ